MAFIDADYYENEFHGTPIPSAQFDRLVEIASDVIDGLITVEMSYDGKKELQSIKKATAYQLEFLNEHGGLDVILGMSDIGNSSESLGDYSVSGTADNSGINKTSEDIPVSPMALLLLRREGLMCRWLYANAWAHGKQKIMP